MQAMVRFMKSLWLLQEWRIGYPYLKTGKEGNACSGLGGTSGGRF